MSKSIYKSVLIVVCFMFAAVVEIWAGGMGELREPERGKGVLVYRSIAHPGTTARWTRQLVYENIDTGKRHSFRFSSGSKTQIVTLPAGRYLFVASNRYDGSSLDETNERNFHVAVRVFVVQEGTITPFSRVFYYYNTRLSHDQAMSAPRPIELGQYETEKTWWIDGGIQTHYLILDQ
jgi:hypothetical protein